MAYLILAKLIKELRLSFPRVAADVSVIVSSISAIAALHRATIYGSSLPGYEDCVGRPSAWSLDILAESLYGGSRTSVSKENGKRA
jgi:hypothetical protein